MDGAPRLSGTERVYAAVTTKNREKSSRMFPPERKSVVWIADLIDSFLKSDELLVIIFTSTFVAANACFIFRSPSFRELQADAACFLAKTEDLLKTIAKKASSVMYENFGTVEGVHACDIIG